MLKVNFLILDSMDEKYPGVRRSILAYDEAPVPLCPSCSSPDTAVVQSARSQFSAQIALATTKIHVAPQGTRAGHYYCNSCGGYFDR